MKITIVPDDKIIVVDGKPIKFDYNISGDIHAVQWNETEGEVEHKDPDKANKRIVDFSDYQYLIDLYSLEDQKIKDLDLELERQRIKDLELEQIILDPDEAKIQTEINKLNRAAAIQSLKDKGELPADYK